jgi:hypothetical protein
VGDIRAGYFFYKGEPVDSPELPGPPVIKCAVETDSAQAVVIANQVRQWLINEKLDPEEIVVLVAKQPKSRLYELLSTEELTGNIEWAFETHGKRRTILVDTVKRFKGLEAQAVILWLGDEITEDQQWETIYVGATRAKSLLCIVGSKKTLAELKLHDV